MNCGYLIYCLLERDTVTKLTELLIYCNMSAKCKYITIDSFTNYVGYINGDYLDRPSKQDSGYVEVFVQLILQ